MNLFARLGALTAHPDPLTAACNRIAFVVVANQPFYPLYVWWLVGAGWSISLLTFVSTPLFAAVPIVARRSSLAGRALLPLAGVANGLLSAKAFGTASAVEWFLLPCALIAVLGFRRGEWRTTAALTGAVVAVALLHDDYGAPLGHFGSMQYAHFRALNGYSVASLSVVIVWLLIRARASSARQ